jgi:endonuclease/exonuclease/phosphatase family metal-dependent hydrolase
MNKTIVKERKVLMNYLNDNVPLRSLDDNLIIATWNVKKFGPTKEDRAIQYIADIVERFDIVAFQEVQNDLDGLRRLQKLLPGNYQFLVSETTGNNERFAFFFDKRSVISTGYVSNLTFPVSAKTHIGYQIHRVPYAASFKAGRFDFIIVNVHILFGEGNEGEKMREEEINKLVDYIHKMSVSPDGKTFDKDIFVMGDFNINKYGDKFFNALKGKNFLMPDGMDELKTNTKLNKTFDKIAWVPRKSFIHSGRFGVIDFNGLIYKGLEPAKLCDTMSDHLPLWAEFKIKVLEQELDSYLK